MSHEQSFKSQYLQGLNSCVHPPVPVHDVKRLSRNQLNNRAAILSADVSRMLHAEGIEPIVVGSASSLLHLREAFERTVHDVDFLIPSEQLIGAQRLLKRNGFRLWNENNVHRTVRNLTGGFGRHHNYGASSPAYSQETDLPIWIGLFDMQGQRNSTTFKEIYAISKYKIKIALSTLWKSVGEDFNPRSKQIIEKILTQPLSVESMLQIIDQLKGEGVNFWDIINLNEVNELDVKRRKLLKPTHPEKFIEVEMTQKYPVSPKDYADPTKERIFDTDVYAVNLETTYWRMEKHHPHYLRARAKYTESAQQIFRSGRLRPHHIDAHQNIIADRTVSHQPVNVFLFSHDLTISSLGFDENKQDESHYLAEKSGVDPNINYWALLLEGVHYTYS